MTRTLADVESDIRAWIAQSKATFQGQFADPSGETWVLKFFPPQYFASFMQQRKLVISVTPGFTWGDGVYVVPIDHVYSAMIYGRVGVMGWIDKSELSKVYDAADATGLALYREWIQFKPGLFALLTTTVHAQFANRRLRNAFKKRFEIDLVVFRPDEFNRAYVQPASDRWFVLSDFSPAVSIPGATAGSTRWSSAPETTSRSSSGKASASDPSTCRTADSSAETYSSPAGSFEIRKPRSAAARAR